MNRGGAKKTGKGGASNTEIAVESDAPVKPSSTVLPVKAPSVSRTPEKFVLDHYLNAGWQAISTYPKKGQADIIAKRDLFDQHGKQIKAKSKYHFVHVRTPEMLLSAPDKYTGEQLGAFVQNAFSNEAVPVYATVKTVSGNRKISFVDANSGGRLVVN